MLYLTRELGQRIKVGDVIIEVAEIKRGAVRIGIDAPKAMHIDRLDKKEVNGNK